MIITMIPLLVVVVWEALELELDLEQEQEEVPAMEP